MRTFRQFTLVAPLLVLLAVTVLAQTPASGAESILSLSPDTIEVGSFYRGADVQVKATVPDCDAAVLIMEAGGEEAKFNRKGREAGLWLNVAQVTISGAPKVYLLASSKPVEEIGSSELRSELGLGLPALRRQMHIESEQDLIGVEADEFLELKARSGAYRTDLALELSSGNGENRTVSAVLPVSPTVPPGMYQVKLYCFADGNLVHKEFSDLTITRVGTVAFLTSLAHDRAAIYGVFAVLIAMLVGIVMGVIFHSLPGSGH